MEFDDFFDAFGDGGTVEEAPAAEEQPETEQTQEQDTAEETAQEEGSEPDSQEEGGEQQQEEGSEPAGEQQEQEEQSQEEGFTVSVGGEDRQLSRDEATAYAQKGILYDDLQARMDAVTQERDSIQETLGKYQEVMDILEPIAKKVNVDTVALARQFYINVRKGEGVTEHEAAMELDFAQLKKQVGADKPEKKEAPSQEQINSDRMKRELDEFHQLYPGAVLNEALAEKLKDDVQRGMSLSNAYQKMLNAQKAAELEEQARQMKAANQNRVNKMNSPGSQQDSGGRREKSGFDDFFGQFCL